MVVEISQKSKKPKDSAKGLYLDTNRDEPQRTEVMREDKSGRSNIHVLKATEREQRK